MLYKDYLLTSHWKEIRTKFLSRPHNQRCAICGNTNNLNVHHKRYTSISGNRVLFNERMDQLITLCRDCHNSFHQEYGKKHLGKKLLARLRRNHSMTINNGCSVSL